MRAGASNNRSISIYSWMPLILFDDFRVTWNYTEGCTASVLSGGPSDLGSRSETAASDFGLHSKSINSRPQGTSVSKLHPFSLFRDSTLSRCPETPPLSRPFSPPRDSVLLAPSFSRSLETSSFSPSRDYPFLQLKYQPYPPRRGWVSVYYAINFIATSSTGFSR